jgi:hypothetical protein
VIQISDRSNQQPKPTPFPAVVNPGYGWGNADTSAVCDTGFYNPGYNTRRCAPCPGGLTTAATGTTTPTQCVAPPGYYYMRGKAVACPKGFYKSLLGNADCLACPDGFTTKDGEVAKTAHTDCNCERRAPGVGGLWLLGRLEVASALQLQKLVLSCFG